VSGATRGIYLERRAAEILASRGWFTIRAAGSHGIADVVAVRPGEVVLVQCKTDGAIRSEEWNRLYDVATALGAVAVVCQYDTDTHRRIVLIRITGTHTPRSREWPHETWNPARVNVIPVMDKDTAAKVAALELERLQPTPRRGT
jgi:Holliday junction resolvase